ncbi:IS3 family transposase [Streptomyces sp. NBC_01474]|uniref:IS3 family transposase n=1 Tax=unclassified Streptomyces TaxID=2593676 RepID=UPI002DDB422C|nr:MULTISPECIES: IS3 family transposase [unclassified Streptomyces]WSD92961.1 IS3 family transposase [Streptomyces sp. NBC_01474]
MRYAFIDAERAAEANPGGHSVALLCRVLGVSRSGYYAYLSGRLAAEKRACQEERLIAEIRHHHDLSRRAYGAPRVTAALRRGGHRVNHKRVERLMREHGISGITRRRRRGLTRADRNAIASPDLVGRDFTAAEPGTKLVGDITYLPTLAGWWYLATVIDLATREVVGYGMADHHRAGLVVDALRMAAGRGALKEGCIAHSDRGSELGLNRSSQHHRLDRGDQLALFLDPEDRSWGHRITYPVCRDSANTGQSR